MTLIIAADAQDHLILAGDHCAVLSRVSNRGEPEAVLDNYRKVYPWKYGAIAASGDVFLMMFFYRLFMHYDSTGQPIDLLRVARQAKAMRSRQGTPPTRSTGNIFFTLPGHEGFQLHVVSVQAETISAEIIAPIGAQFSMREGTPDDPACHAFTGRLRPSFFFRTTEEFHHHHLDLFGAFFAAQSAIDERVTSSFDMYMLDKQMGVGMFWQRPETTKQIAFIDLQDGKDDARTEAGGICEMGVDPKGRKTFHGALRARIRCNRE